MNESEIKDKSKANKHYLFVYGSLLSHNSYHFYLQNCSFIGKAVLEDFGLYKIDWYPGIIKRKGSKVLGEVYEIDDYTLQKIDSFEEEGILYKREKVKVLLEESKELETWTYIYSRDVEEENYIPFEEQPWRD